MKSFRNITHFMLVFFILYLGVLNNGEEEEEIVLAPMEKTEKEALYSTIQGFVGNWWNGSDLYPDPCGWTPIQGVSCDIFDGSWYVTDLNIGPIHDNSLACAPNFDFRPRLFELKRLKSLSFFGCFISSHHRPITIPTENWELLSGSLELLEFRSNPGLIGQIPTNFGNLKRLQSLVLLENGLTGKLPTNLGNLTNLRRLVLAGNRFTGRIPDSFGGLSELLIFDSSRNSLSGPLPLTFGGLTSLLKLDLSNNQLDGKIPNQFGNLKNLTLLDLSYNKFSNGLTNSIQEMTCLQELILSNNPIGGDLKTLQWPNLKGLVTLDLSNMGLTNGVPESITELKRLRFLGLNDNNLTGFVSPKFSDLPSLSGLFLNGNNLTGELQFSEWFYGKMGRRFGAWGNPNLCYPVGLVSNAHIPIGLKPCKQEVNLYGLGSTDTESKLLGYGNLDQNSQIMMASLGLRLSISRVDWFWYIAMIEIIMIVPVFNFPI